MYPIYCHACRAQTPPHAAVCPRCGATLVAGHSPQPQQISQFAPGMGHSSGDRSSQPSGILPERVRRLVDRFEASKNQPPVTRFGYRSIEAQIRNDFLHAFFEELGWDMHNQRGGPREVVVEQDIPGSNEKVDYCFRLGGHPKFFVEAKRPTVTLEADQNIGQIFEYSRKSGVRLVILTNFEEFAVYGWCVKATRRKKPVFEFIQVGKITYHDYERRWWQIAAVFSRTAVEQGRLDEALLQIEQAGEDFNLFDDAPRSRTPVPAAFSAGPPQPPQFAWPHAHAALPPPPSYGGSVQPFQAPPPYPRSRPAGGNGAAAGKVFSTIVLLGGVVVVLLGGTCIAVVAMSRPDERPSTGSRPPITTPPRAPAEPGRRQCPLASWDRAVRGWDKLGSPVCRYSGAVTGYYLRITFGEDEATSRKAVAQAWRRYVDTYITGGACPSAEEMMFFDPSPTKRAAGAGIFFRQRPPGWDAVMLREPQWKLHDRSESPVDTPVCFFRADNEEWRRPDGWSR
jgi:hypothetical protein